LLERSTDQKAGAAARGRGLAGVSADCVVWWSTVEKFGGGNDGGGALKMRYWKMGDWNYREQETYGTPRVA